MPTEQTPHDLLEELHQLNAALREENARLRRENELLKRQLDELKRMIYGRKSEKVNPDQLKLFTEGARDPDEPPSSAPKDETPDFEEPPAPTKRKRGPHPGRAPLPAHLEREVIHLHPENLDCPHCGSRMEPAGQEVSEELGVVPARFFVRHRVRHKYACPACQDAVVRPPLPPAAIDKCQAGSDVLSAILVSKYADHLPLHRQQAIYRRGGVELSRVTMCHWVGQCAFLLQPIVDRMRTDLLSSPVVQSDDTRVKYLEPPGPAKTGSLWAYVSAERDVLYDFTAGRSRAGPNEFLAGFAGVLQVDGYAAYNEVLAAPGVRHAGCWAHVRRKFERALSSQPEEAGVVMQRIAELYRLERDLKEKTPLLTAAEIVAIRQREAAPRIAKLKDYLVACRQKVLPQSPMGEAIDYAFGQWPFLETYLADGLVEIDNNSCERAMRRVAVGRKNWLFTGSEQGGRNAAVIYSLIETCARSGIDPHAYLTDVLTRIGAGHPQSRVGELTPRAWAAARA